jgi:glyoxylate/hydroxypyruvate reductase A
VSILLIGDLTRSEYESWRERLSACLPASEKLFASDEDYERDDIDIALVANPPAGSLSQLPNLRFIQSLWAGVDRLLSDPTLPTDVPVSRLVDPNLTQAMVECVVAHVLFLHRQIPQYLGQQSSAEWKQWTQPLAMQRRVGMLGLGQLGGAAAQALSRLGFDVVGWSAAPRTVKGIRTLHSAERLNSVLRDTEILVNLLPLTPQTTGILRKELFHVLPRGASIINLARGEHLVEEDLIDALATGHISHAILDVFRTEPLPPQHPFWSHPRVSVFPHVAAATDPDSATQLAANNIAAFRAGRTPVFLVDRRKGY